MREASGQVTWFQTTLAVLIGFRARVTVTIDPDVVALTAWYRYVMVLALSRPGTEPHAAP